MLTRLEVHGFKNLMNLAIDFGPFTCIAGENGTGKSNVFDAVQFLSLLADKSMMEAAQEVRGVHGERHGDPRDLFWKGFSGAHYRMSLAAEMIVPLEVEDDFGRVTHPTTSFLRYELEIGYQEPSGLDRFGRLTLLREDLRHITKGAAKKHLRFPHSAGQFRNAVIVGHRSGAPFISTDTDTSSDESIVKVHQDGGSRGQPKPAAASRAPATVVSTITSSDDQTILAARREMESWRRLALEPSALRSADRFIDPPTMGVDGSHLPAALYRVAHTPPAEGEPDPARVFARVAGRLSDLTGVQIRDLAVDQDEVRQLLTVQVREADGMMLPARSLSEGTLRFLALCVLLEDPTVRGMVCMEEPENGIHPANLVPMVDLVRDLAVDPAVAPAPDNPFRQVLINTHSPGVVQLVSPEELLFADTALHRLSDGSTVRALRLRPLADTWREAGGRRDYVTKADILPYLTTPPGAQTTLDLGVA
ncbi:MULTISPECIES: AAA family ATPase [unclassified Streptomyces]|uniref:AAA family ATPase n=1 Tax=unclassified Streptomyces TaxID=2593676 RepID=UPI0022B735BD|nr:MULTISPECIES: AAA family ATPase [unclassified Streptomyces]MCZ7414915.1 AAA family ATPase [Streptomyces sp. WMMC897]MCZ7431858.1 AAA family ATPase [Streptomyces sp. WMMC1477]